MNNNTTKLQAGEMKAEQFIRLADAIIKRHQETGPGSPLKSSMVAEMSFKNNAIREKHEEGMRYLKIAFEAFYERDLLIGIAPEATENPKTLQSYIERVRQALADICEGQEALWQEWGFTKLPEDIEKNH